MAQQTGGLLMGLVLGAMAGGLAVHLYDTQYPASSVSEPATVRSGAPTCADKTDFENQLAILQNQLKAVPPVIKGENGTADAPNRLYEALKSEIAKTAETLKALGDCPAS